MRVSDSALLVWSVIETIGDLPATPEVQREHAEVREGFQMWIADFMATTVFDDAAEPPIQRLAEVLEFGNKAETDVCLMDGARLDEGWDSDERT